MDKIFDIYTDYLQVNSGQATAIGLSKILDNKIDIFHNLKRIHK